MKLLSIRLFLVLVTIGSFHSNIYAQEISMEETLAYINRKLAGGSVVDVERGVIIAKYNQGGQLYREDQVLCKALDLSSMGYDSNEKVFYINCTGSAKCVDRQLFVRKIQRDYARLSFPVNLDSKGVEGFKKAFAHMIKLVNEPKYKSSEPFE